MKDVKKNYLRRFATFEDPLSCFVVVVGGEYICRMEAVMKRVEGKYQIGEYLGFRIPETVFVFLPEKYPMTVYGKDNRHTLSPTMVKRVSFLNDSLLNHSS